MPNPKHKISKARRDSRRTHYKLVAPVYVLCPQCREPKLPHHACLSCGMYKGKEVIATQSSS
jgi:large subunit ribosomal protein L32